MKMYRCAVANCHGAEAREETRDRVYQIDNGEHVVVYGVPVTVCVNCGELTFSVEDAEKVGAMLYDDDQKSPKRVIIPAFEFAQSEPAAENLILATSNRGLNNGYRDTNKEFHA